VPAISDRLREEREGLGLSQQAMSETCGVTARSQRNYESGERVPDASYLAALCAAGADVLYVLTGKRDRPASISLTDDEKGMLADYREASGPVRRAARAALQSGSTPAPGSRIQTISAPVSGVVAGGRVVIKNNK
jgi:transcriptional regulator with XRE-family HTH domain